MLAAIVFITGAAILALELLASRILTPYFGVSLYIWSGILSITLISLALGYWLGGRIARRRQNATHPDQLAYQFARMPALAAIAIVIACVAYPYLFHQLARMDLVLGAFLACLILLFVPLVATSAMNPLLVAILLRNATNGGELADAGAGRVFFISTVGSVAGVLVTAFGLIPNLSNFVSVLWVAVTLALMPPLLLFAGRIKIARRKQLNVQAALALTVSLGMLAASGAYVERMWPVAFEGRTWSVEKTYRSMFGTVKILKSEPQADGGFDRIYFQDGMIQNTADSSNRSRSTYTYALEALISAYRPDTRNALVLGIGAGMVPMRLASRGMRVSAVDIDPASLRASKEIFGYDDNKVQTHLADARTFLRDCNREYRAIVVDLFHGDGVPDYVVTRDFYRDLKRCLDESGIAVFNTFADLDAPRIYAHFLTTLRSELPFIAIYRPANGVHINSYVVASSSPLPPPMGVDLSHVPPRQLQRLSELLRDPIPLDQALLDRGRIITDAQSTVANDIATSQLTNRRYAVEVLPPAFLLN